MNAVSKVTGLWIYPVKSCRGISLKEMPIGPLGPLHDRQWMLVDVENQFITRRTQPRLAEIITSVQGPFLHLYLNSNKILINHTEDCETIEMVTVWGESFFAGIESRDVNNAISDFLEKSVKLVRYQKQSHRNLNQAGTQTVKEMMFADSRPILLTNENSLHDLNAKLIQASRMDRFRSNIIIDGLAAYDEDKIVKVQVGNVVFENPKLCARCPIVTQDAETGEVVSLETLTTLASYRKVQGNKVMFGVNLTPANIGIIRINDFVKISN